MARRIKGIDIVLVKKNKVGVDPIGSSIYEYEKETISNVLISPVRSEDIINQTNLKGIKAVYILAIPKGDSHIWSGNEVEFFNEVWQVIGEESIGLEHMIPLDWNKKVTVGRYEQECEDKA